MIRVVDAPWAGPNALLHVGLVGQGRSAPAGGVPAGGSATAGGDRARPHVHPHRPLDAEAPAGVAARQAGSLVAPGRLRFDFPHPSAVPLEVLEEAELEANRRLALDDAVRIYETTFDEAKAQGAILSARAGRGTRASILVCGVARSRLRNAGAENNCRAAREQKISCLHGRSS